MSFRVRFVASDIRPVELDPGDADILRGELLELFDETRLGMPHLLARLKDGREHGDEITVDERQCEELFMAIGAAADHDGLSPGLEALRRAVERFLDPADP
jgi:hypothetical protein